MHTTLQDFSFVEHKLLKMKKLTLLVIAFHAAIMLNGQGNSASNNLLVLDENTGSQLFVQVKAHVGRHLYTGKYFHEHLKDVSYATSIRFGWRTSGKKDWEKALNFPLYGVGVFGGRIGEREIFWKPNRHIWFF